MNLKSQKVMTSEKNIINPGSQHPDRALRAKMQDALNAAIHSAWKSCVEECAADYATHPPFHEWYGDHADFVEHGWYYRLGGLDDYAYGYLHPVAQQAAKRLYRKHRLRQRPDAAKWRKWLAETARTICLRCAMGTEQVVAARMAELFAERFGLEFSYYLSDGRAVFVLSDGSDGEDLGADWEVLADLHVRGRCRGDADYLRVLYVYSPERQLLLCLHHTYVAIPSGGWSLEWVLWWAWWNVSPEDARQIASSEVGVVEAEE